MKPGTEQDILQACQAHLRALQPVRKVEVRYRTIRRERPEATAELILETEMGRLSYFYEIKRSLSLPRLEHVLLQFERDSSEAESRPLLLADYLPPRPADLPTTCRFALAPRTREPSFEDSSRQRGMSYAALRRERAEDLEVLLMKA